MDLLVFNDIKNGSSKSGDFWIKHALLSDEVRFEELNLKYLNYAVKKKALLEVDAISLANKNKTWTEADQNDLNSNISFVKRLQENYEKIIEAQKKYIYDDLVKEIAKVEQLKARRAHAIGKTAEEWAKKISTERYILSLFFKDQLLTVRAWDDNEIEFLDQETVDGCFLDFFDYRKRVNDESLKELACSCFCQNLYGVAGNPFLFFGKSVADLTSNQQRFLLLMEYYKNIITNISGKVPSHVYSDWKELDKWAASGEKSREELENKWTKFNGQGDKINFENIKKASMAQGEGKENKAIIELLS
jgi:hypothetical protein